MVITRFCVCQQNTMFANNDKVVAIKYRAS